MVLSATLPQLYTSTYFNTLLKSQQQGRPTALGSFGGSLSAPTLSLNGLNTGIPGNIASIPSIPSIPNIQATPTLAGTGVPTQASGQQLLSQMSSMLSSLLASMGTAGGQPAVAEAGVGTVEPTGGNNETEGARKGGRGKRKGHKKRHRSENASQQGRSASQRARNQD